MCDLLTQREDDVLIYTKLFGYINPAIKLSSERDYIGVPYYSCDHTAALGIVMKFKSDGKNIDIFTADSLWYVDLDWQDAQNWQQKIA